MSLVDEYVKLQKDYDRLKMDYAAQGKQNDQMNHMINTLTAENKRMLAMTSEHYDITVDALKANVKIVSLCSRVKSQQTTIKILKDKLAHKLSDKDVIELIRAYANKKEEAEILKRIIERIKDVECGTDKLARDTK